MVINQSLYIYGLFALIISIYTLIGFMKGYKKSLYSLIVMLIFYGLFFLTIDIGARLLWSTNFPGLGILFEQIDTQLKSASSFEDALPKLLEIMLGDTVSFSTNEEFITFVSKASLLIMKMIYTVLYFTIISFIYKIMSFIVRLIVFKSKASNEQLDSTESHNDVTSKQRGLGGMLGVLRGSLSIYMIVIILGGLMSISDSVTTLLNEENELEELESTVSSYNNNYAVKTFELITIKDDALNENVPVTHILFDYAYSFKYNDKRISPRKELTYAVALNDLYEQSEYKESENLSNITGTEVKKGFTILADSELITATLPLIIELAAEEIDPDMELPKEEIYDLDWETELNQFGKIATVTFDLLNTASDDENVELKTVSFEGEKVKDVFNAFSESKVVTLSASEFIYPLIDQMDDDLQTVITVPENMDWKKEIRAIGLVAAEVADTDATLEEFESGDPTYIVSTLSDIDTTVVLESKLMTHSLVNIFSGNADVTAFDQLVVPEDIIWFDQIDSEGNRTQDGELRLILTAINEISKISSELDLDHIDSLLFDHLSEVPIDIILNSRIIHATIGNLIFEEGEGILTIPSNSLEKIVSGNEEIQIITVDETRKLLKAASTLAFNDVETMKFDASIIHNLATDDDSTKLDSEKSDQVLDSSIIHATLSTMLFDLATGNSDVLEIPEHTFDGESVRITDEVEYISKEELTHVLRGVLSLELSDFNDVETLEITRITNHLTVLLESAIFHATISDQLLTLGDHVLLVPAKDVNETSVKRLVGDAGSETNYIEKDEISNLLSGLNLLGITDINSFSGNVSLDNLNSDYEQTTLLSSASMHATISKKLLELEDSVLIVPTRIPSTNTNIQKTVAETNFVSKQEVKAIINAFIEMGYTDMEHTNSVNPSNVLSLDYDVLLSSASIQATISDLILEHALDEQATYGSSTLIVPTYFREDVEVAEQTDEQVKQDELKSLLTGLELLNVSDFGGSMNASLITSTSQLELEIMLQSGSIHTTYDNMLKGNSSITIPELAKHDTLYQTDITTKEEIRNFILAANTITSGSGDFTSVTFDMTSITSLTESDQDIVLSSMIVRNVLTTEIHSNIGPNTLDSSYYENGDRTTLLTKEGIQYVITNYSSGW